MSIEKSKLEKFMKTPLDRRLEKFLETLSLTNRGPDYYVDWNKVIERSFEFELELNTLNFLVGKENIYDEALILFKKQPELLKAVPILIACRDTRIDILKFDESYSMSFSDIDFINIDTNKIVEYVDFVNSTGLLNFLQNIAKRSLIDYVYGVEVGLDSNARKNRSGKVMESILEFNINKITQKLNFEWGSQLSSKNIKDRWGVYVPSDKSSRRFDFAIFDHRIKRLWIIETNYYGSGGSKLKSVSGEFITLNNLIKNSCDDINFVWVTDGKGWLTAKSPLEEAFSQIDFIFNLYMLNDGYLTDLINL